MAPAPPILSDSDSSSNDEAPCPQPPTASTFVLLSSSEDDDDKDAQDDGRQGHKPKMSKQPPSVPAASKPPAAAGKKRALPKWKPRAEVEEQEQGSETDEDDDASPRPFAARGGWLSGGKGKKRQKGAAGSAAAVDIKLEKGTTAAVPIKPEPSAAIAAAVPIKQEKGAAGGKRKRTPAVAVKNEEVDAEGSEESSDGLGYDSFGDPIVDPLAKPRGAPKGEAQLAEWRMAVGRALLETTKEVKILDCVVRNLAAKLTSVAKETAEGQRAALEVIEDGKRAAEALKALARLEGGASAASVLAVVSGNSGGGDEWAMDLPMQESDSGPPEVVLPSAAEVAALKARVERAERAKREAKDRKLFKAQEQAPLAFAAAASGKVGVRAPELTGAQSGLETALSIPLTCTELYGYLSTKEMGRLRQVSRLAKRDYDTEKYAKALREYIDACKKEQRAAAGEGGQADGAAAAPGGWMARLRGGRRQKKKRWARVKREPLPVEEEAVAATAAPDSSSVSDKSRKKKKKNKKKKNKKRARAASIGSGADTQGGADGGDWDESLLEDEEEAEEGKGEGDLDAAVEEAITLGYQHKHGLGQGMLEVRKKAGAFKLHSEMATQARSSRDHAVRRTVEALLKPHGLLLFSEVVRGGGNSDGSDEEEEEEEEEDEDPTALIQVHVEDREKVKEAPVRPKLAKGWDRKRIEAEAAKHISTLVDLTAQLEFNKGKQKRLEKELKALRKQMRGLGCGVTTTVPGLGTVAVGEPSVAAVTYKNELDTEVFASLPEQTREAILYTGLVVYQDEQLVTSMGGKGARKQGGESLLEVERKGSGHLPEYRNVRVLNAKAKVKAARGQQQG